MWLFLLFSINRLHPHFELILTVDLVSGTYFLSMVIIRTSFWNFMLTIRVISSLTRVQPCESIVNKYGFIKRKLSITQCNSAVSLLWKLVFIITGTLLYITLQFLAYITLNISYPKLFVNYLIIHHQGFPPCCLLIT